jgi:1-acyl-sn-glycerol-3-phosphate acyltransferase
MAEISPFPWQTVLGAAWAVVSGGKRSLRQDAIRCTRRLRIKILGAEHIPQAGPGVVLVNHYYRPGFSAAWIGLAVSAVVPVELVWVMSAAWTEADTIWTRLKAAASVPLYPRLARVYGLISMPPMPPRPHEVAARARAVRQILAVARQNPPALLAIAPEGQDPPGGVLMRPPSGVGRMLARLSDSGGRFYPVGVYEQDEIVVLHFGSSFHLMLPRGLNTDEKDIRAAEMVMQAIAALLPADLRGAYA